MKKPTTSEQVFQKLFPAPKPNGPVTWTQHVQRNLVPEVREEGQFCTTSVDTFYTYSLLQHMLTTGTVQRYFGRIDCIEAQYPGLDYTFDPHRRRLATFPWHRRLFRAFEDLHLTKGEILLLCNWEGTRAAKERFERESHTAIESTTLEGIDSLRTSNRPRGTLHHSHHIYRESNSATPQPLSTSKWIADIYDNASDDEENTESIGVRLNHNLIAAAAARERGEAAHHDAQFEQWMKEAIERADDPEAIRNMLQHTTATTTAVTTGDNASHPVDEPASTDTETVPGFSARPQSRSGTEYAHLSNLVDQLSTSNTRLEADNSRLQHFLSRTRTETAR